MSIPITCEELEELILVFFRVRKQIAGSEIRTRGRFHLFTLWAKLLIDMYHQGPGKFEWRVKCQNAMELLNAQLTQGLQGLLGPKSLVIVFL